MVGRYGYIGSDLQLFIEKFSTDKRFFLRLSPLEYGENYSLGCLAKVSLGT